MNILLRILAFPFVLGIILLKYIFHALHNSFLFLYYGGEWITYAKNERSTIKDIFEEIKTQRKP